MSAPRVVVPDPPLVAESSERRGKVSAGKKMGRVKRDIPVYAKVMSETSSALPAVGTIEGGSSSVLVPTLLVAASTPPATGPSVEVICSSPDRAADDGGRKVLGLPDPVAPKVPLSVVPSDPGASTVGDMEW